jgi:hypothetical protein
MQITSNISQFDQKLNQFSFVLKQLSEQGLDNKEFMQCLKVGTKVLQSTLESNYLAADPTGMGGKVAINVGIFEASRNKNKNNRYYIIGADYRNSKGWQVWHLLNFGFVHDLGKVLGKAGKFSTKQHAETLTVVAGKHFLEKSMAQSGDEALALIENEVSEFLKNKTENG